MIETLLWILFHIVPICVFYSVGGALLYRPVYRHFYEKARLSRIVERDRWGEPLIRNGSRSYIYVSHDKAHEKALQSATIAAALWPFTMWPLLVFKTATPVTAARKAELAELEEERKLEADLRRKKKLSQLESELGIDNTVKAIDWKSKEERR